MARFAACVALALIVLTAAVPTPKPTTAPPSLRPTAPSPRPTSSTPQPTDLIRILEQDVQSAPFDLPSNICAAFQVQFEGGSDKKFRVEITDWATWENCKPSNHRPTEYPSEEPVFDTPATGQLDQPVSAGYGHGTPVASAPPVEQSSGWTWSKATPAQQANRFNMCL